MTLPPSGGLDNVEFRLKEARRNGLFPLLVISINIDEETDYSTLLFVAYFLNDT